MFSFDSSTMEDDAVVPNDEICGMATSTPTKALKQNSLRTKTIDSSTMEDDAIVPNDEICGMATSTPTKALKQNGLRTKTKIPPDQHQHQRQRQHHRFTNQKHLSGTSIEKPREIIAYPTDDDHRFTNRKHLSGTSIEKPREIIAYPTDDDHRFTSRKHLSVTSIEKSQERIASPIDDDHRFTSRKHLSVTSIEKPREIIASPTDDEDRIPPPPPMEIVTNSSTNHPDFEAWKRDMTETLFTGTVMTSLIKSPKTTIQRTDWQTTRLNRRRLEKKWLQQQLRSVKSDTSTTTESESGGDEDSSLQSGYSSTFLHIRTDDRKSSESKPRSGHVRTDAQKSSESKPRSGHDIEIHTVYIRNQPEDTENTNIHVESLPQTIPAPLSPRSLAMERPTMSAQEAPLSPNAQPNSKDLAEILVELADLKTWAEGVEHRLRRSTSTSTPPSSPMVELAGLKTWAEGVEHRLRQSTPPSSPKPPAPPANLTTEAATKVTTKAATKGLAQKDTSLPKSIEVPQLLPTPKSIIVPQLHEPGKKYTSMIERRVFSKEKGIPTMLTIQTTANESESKTKKEHVKKAIKQNKKKGVRFTKPLITDTKYRPKTRREDVDALFFQEEELLDWENDEETTLNDRFEVVATEFGNQVLHQGNEKDEDKRSTGKLSIGTPLISFHTSYSNSFQDSSDEESSNSC